MGLCTSLVTALTSFSVAAFCPLIFVSSVLAMREVVSYKRQTIRSVDSVAVCDYLHLIVVLTIALGNL